VNDLAAVWDALAGDRTAIFGHPTLTWEEGVTLCRAQIEPLLATERDFAHITDLGCGQGRLLRPLASSFPSLFFAGLDISLQMLGTPRADVMPVWRENIFLTYHDIREPFPFDEPIDGAYSVLVLQHFDHDGQRAVLKNVHEALRPGGWFRFQFVCEGEEGDLSHPTPIMEMVHWAIEAGFVIAAPSGQFYDDQPEFPTWAWITARKP
jgi:SAM-dependent methyltransferase